MILWGEIRFRSLLGLKGLKVGYYLMTFVSFEFVQLVRFSCWEQSYVVSIWLCHKIWFTRVDIQASTSEGFLKRGRTVNYYNKSFRGQIQDVREATELVLTISHFPYIHHGLACLLGGGGVGTCTESLVNNNVHCTMQYACEKQWQTDGQKFNPVRCYILFCKFDCLFVYLFIYLFFFFFEVKWKGVG